MAGLDFGSKGAFYQKLFAANNEDDLFAYALCWRWLMGTYEWGWDCGKIAVDCNVSMGFAMLVMDDVKTVREEMAK